MAKKLGTFALVPTEIRKSVEPGELLVEFGEYSFTTTGTTVEVPTDLTEVLFAFALPNAYAGSAVAGGEVYFCDKAITSGKVTVSRKVAVDSGNSFSYMFVGRKVSTSA